MLPGAERVGSAGGTCGAGNGPDRVPDGADVGEFRLLTVSPHVLLRVEFGGMGRWVLLIYPTVEAAQIIPGECASMGQIPVRDQPAGARGCVAPDGRGSRTPATGLWIDPKVYPVRVSAAVTVMLFQLKLACRVDGRPRRARMRHRCGRWLRSLSPLNTKTRPSSRRSFAPAKSVPFSSGSFPHCTPAPAPPAVEDSGPGMPAPSRPVRTKANAAMALDQVRHSRTGPPWRFIAQPISIRHQQSPQAPSVFGPQTFVSTFHPLKADVAPLSPFTHSVAHRGTAHS